MIPYELHLALRYLTFLRGRTFISTLVSIVGVMVGVGALVVAQALMNGFVTDFRERILSGGAHVQILNAFDKTTDEGGDVMAAASGLPGIEAVAPVVFTRSMLVGEGDRQAYAELWGVDPKRQADVLDADDATREALRLLDGSTTSGRDAIVLGHNLAESMAVVPGELVRVVVPSMTLSPFGAFPRTRQFEVVGSYRSEHFEQDAVRAYARLDAIQSLMRVGQGISHVEVRVTDLRDLEARKEQLREALGGPWVVIDMIEQNEMFIRAFNEEKKYLALAIWLIVGVAALNILSTLIAIVMEKVRDIGALTAMGAKPRGVAVTFVLQGVIIGLVGTVLGLGLGSGLSYVLDRYEVFTLDPDVYYLTHVRFLVQWFDLLRAASLAMGTALLATLYPAWKAATVNPVEAIRYE